MRVTSIVAVLTVAAVLLPATALAQDAETGQAAKPAQKQQKKREPLYDETADANEQLAAALASAKNENRRVLIQWGANWCGWCYRLNDLFESNRDIKRKLLYEYDLVHIDIGRRDKNMDLAKRFGVDLKKEGVPYLTFLDGDGNLVANQDTGSLGGVFDGKPAHDPAKVLAVLEKHQAAPLSAESVLKDALAKAEAENKIVFLHFGAPWCVWCKRMEAWMAIEDVEKVLGKDFIDVKIDTDRMTGGQEMLQHYTGGKSSGIPFFAFLSPDGKVIADSWYDEGKNLGCPWAPEEIEIFRKLLAEVADDITEDEIEAITAKLGPQKKEQEG